VEGERIRTKEPQFGVRSMRKKQDGRRETAAAEAWWWVRNPPSRWDEIQQCAGWFWEQVMSLYSSQFLSVFLGKKAQKFTISIKN
jgi:hypothetical protein